VTKNGGALSTSSPTRSEYGAHDNNLVSTQVRLSWYGVQTRSRHEKRVAAMLQDKTIQAYLPLCTSRNQWSDRRKDVNTPLFPGYVFVRIDEDAQSRVQVLQTNGVVNFLGVRGVGVAIPNEEIETVQAILRKSIPVERHPFLQIGQRVRISGGSLEGLEGVLSAMPGPRRLVISIELIQRSVSIEVTGYDVQPI
jgi:transcriptional antiterminator NusG